MMHPFTKYEQRAFFTQPFSQFMVDVNVAIEAKTQTVEQLFLELCEAIKNTQAIFKGYSFPNEAVSSACFAVCVWADEQIMNAEWEGVSDSWPNSLLQKEFFDTNLGGELFYEKLNTLFGDTIIAHDVYALCLAQGFKGKYVFNLEMQELKAKRNKAIEVSLAYTGLSDPKAETFTTIGYFSKESESASLDAKVVKPIVYTVIVLTALSLFLYFLLQNQASVILKVFT
jgi:type IV/VI secretion system ImpK/VasF family protein